MKTFFIYYLRNNKQKIFIYRGDKRKDAVNEFQYLYGTDMPIKGIKTKKAA